MKKMKEIISFIFFIIFISFTYPGNIPALPISDFTPLPFCKGTVYLHLR
jgi:hypothetical protein